MMVIPITPGIDLPHHCIIPGYKHPHLISELAAFYYLSKLYLIYEMALCNLEQYMLENTHRSMDDDLLVRQVAGIAGAVHAFHSHRAAQISDIASNQEVWLDVCPENILCLGSVGNLKSLGLSTRPAQRLKKAFQNHSTEARMPQLVPNDGAPFYKAPEWARTKACSRATEIWSLGCTFLDILVWYLKGYPALRQFRADRRRDLHPGEFEKDEFYQHTDRIELRQTVLKMMDELSSCTYGPLNAVVPTIGTMLQIEPTARPTAAELETSLERLIPPEPPLPIPTVTPATDEEMEYIDDLGAMSALDVMAKAVEKKRWSTLLRPTLTGK
jgi:serine/threonine protein kinase